MKEVILFFCGIMIALFMMVGCQTLESEEEGPYIRDHIFSEEEESILRTLPFDSAYALSTYVVFDYSIPEPYHTVAFYITAYKDGQIIWENKPVLEIGLSEDFSRKGKIGLVLDQTVLKIQLWDDAEYGLGNECDLGDLEISDAIRGSGMFPEESFDADGKLEIYIHGFEREDRLKWPETKTEYFHDAAYVLVITAQIFK